MARLRLVHSRFLLFSLEFYLSPQAPTLVIFLFHTCASFTAHIAPRQPLPASTIRNWYSRPRGALPLHTYHVTVMLMLQPSPNFIHRPELILNTLNRRNRLPLYSSINLPPLEFLHTTREQRKVLGQHPARRVLLVSALTFAHRDLLVNGQLRVDAPPTGMLSPVRE